MMAKAPVSAQTVDRRTPVHVAMEGDHTDVVPTLLGVGAVVGLVD